MSKSFIIWGKSGCGYCVRAKQIFKNAGYEFQEYSVDEGTLADGVIRGTRDELKAKVPHARTFPQIWVIENDVETYLGGHDDLVKWLADHK